MVGALFFVLVLLVAIGGPLLLYVLVDSEASNTASMDRGSGERVARRDTVERDDE